MPRSLSRSQTDRLGKRLRGSTIPSADDLAELQRVRADCDEVLHAVTDIVRRDLGLEPTQRVKTVQTIIEKLQRLPRMALSKMQDIAGARVVVEGARSAQDHAVRQINSRFSTVKKIDDRRDSPSHGYRAVHVVVEHEGCLVEIQVRTRRQDTWAQFFEGLAGLWGRQIRYGEPPDDPAQKVTADATRAQVVESVRDLAVFIDGEERGEVQLAELDAATAALTSTEVRLNPPVSLDPAIARLQEDRRHTNEWLAERREHLDAIESLLASAIQEMTDEA